MGVFCSRSNQTKRQMGRLLSIFSYPIILYQKLESYCSSGFGGVVIIIIIIIIIIILI